ncbi:MAG: hypothetical protein P8182_02460 [Deltaproteobacteria bacterium]
MLRVLMVALALTVALQGMAYGQGFVDSILGPGGLGFWGTPQGQQPIANQFNSPQFYQGSQGPNGQYFQQPGVQVQPPTVTYSQPAAPGYAQPGVAPQPYGYPNQGYVSQPGVYGQWQNYQAAPTGAPPPVRYSAQQPQAPPGTPAPAASMQSPLRPGQYSPRQGPPMEDDVDRLPPGALRITTTTPEGTTVQYYPPAGQAVPRERTVREQPRRRPARSAARSRKREAPQTQAVESSSASETGQVAMPKPVQIPSGRDPRSGWGLR